MTSTRLLTSQQDGWSIDLSQKLQALRTEYITRNCGDKTFRLSLSVRSESATDQW